MHTAKTPPSNKKKIALLSLGTCVLLGIVGVEAFLENKEKRTPLNFELTPSISQAEQLQVELNHANQNINQLKRQLFVRNSAPVSAFNKKLQDDFAEKEKAIQALSETIKNYEAKISSEKAKVATLESSLAALAELIEFQKGSREDVAKANEEIENLKKRIATEIAEKQTLAEALDIHEALHHENNKHLAALNDELAIQKTVQDLAQKESAASLQNELDKLKELLEQTQVKLENETTIKENVNQTVLALMNKSCLLEAELSSLNEKKRELENTREQELSELGEKGAALEDELRFAIAARVFETAKLAEQYQEICATCTELENQYTELGRQVLEFKSQNASAKDDVEQSLLFTQLDSKLAQERMTIELEDISYALISAEHQRDLMKRNLEDHMIVFNEEREENAKKIRQLDEELHAERLEKQQLLSQLAQTVVIKEAESGQIAQINQELERAYAYTDSLREQLNLHQNLIAEKQQAYDAAIDQHKKEIESREEQHLEVQNSLQEERTRAKELHEAIEKVSHSFTQTQLALKETQEALETIEKESAEKIAALQDALNQKERSLIENLENEQQIYITKLERSLKEAEAELSKAALALDLFDQELTTKTASLNEHIERKNTLEAELNRHKEALSQTEAELEALSLHLKHTNDAHGEIVSEYQQTLRDRENRELNLHQDLERYRNQSDEFQQKEIDRDARIDELERELASKHEEALALSDELNRELKRREIQESNLKQDLEKARIQSDELQRELQQKEADKDARIAELEKALSSKHEETIALSDDLNQELKRREIQESNLKQDLEKARIQSDELQRELQQKEMEKDEIQKRIEMHEARYAAMEEEHLTAIQAVNVYEKHFSTLQNDLEDVQAALLSTVQQLKQKEDAQGSAEERIAHLEQTLHQTEQSLKNAILATENEKGELEARLKAELEKALAETDALSHQLEQKDNSNDEKIKHLQQTLEATKEALSEIEQKLSSKHEETVALSDALNQELKRRELQESNLMQDIERSRIQSEELNRKLQQKEIEKEELLKKVEAQIAELSAKHEDAVALSDALNQELKRREAEESSLKQELETQTENLHRQLQQKEADKDVRIAELSAKHAEALALSEALDEELKRRAAQESSLRLELEAEREELNRQLEAHRAELHLQKEDAESALRQELDKALAQTEQLSNALKEKERAHQAALESVGLYEENFAELQNALDEVRESLVSTVQQMKDQHSKEVAELQESEKQQKEHIELELRNLAASREHLAEMYNEAIHSIEQLQKETDAKQGASAEQIHHLKTEIEHVQSALHSEKKQSEELLQQLEAIRQEYQNAQNSLEEKAALEAKLQVLSDALDDQADELNQLRTVKDALENEVKENNS